MLKQKILLVRARSTAIFSRCEVHIGDYEININDFNELVLYYLTNTDLEVGDKRIELLEKIKKLHQVDGWNKENKRLKLKDSFADSLFSVETKL